MYTPTSIYKHEWHEYEKKGKNDATVLKGMELN